MSNQSAEIISQINALDHTVRSKFINDLPGSLINSDDQKKLATSSLDATKDGTKAEVLTQSLKQLPESTKQTISKNALAWPPPSNRIRDHIWMVVVWAFVILIVGSFSALVASIFSSNAASLSDTRIQIILTVFTTASAFLTGLLAPSPMGTK